MSIQLITQALELNLPQNLKMVMVVLAEFANEEKTCWPSIETIARRASTTSRNAVRILKALEELGMLKRKPRFREDGSQASSLYTLFPEAEAPGSPPSPPDNGASSLPELSGGDAPSVSLTTNKSSEETNNHHNAVVADLIFPKNLDQSEQSLAAQLLTNIPDCHAQQLLDELAGRLRKGGVQSPLGYLRSLVSCYRQELFTPELAVAIARERKARKAEKSAHESKPADPTRIAAPEVVARHIERLKATLGATRAIKQEEKSTPMARQPKLTAAELGGSHHQEIAPAFSGPPTARLMSGGRSPGTSAKPDQPAFRSGVQPESCGSATEPSNRSAEPKR